jgi:hypothetical protein
LLSARQTDGKQPLTVKVVVLIGMLNVQQEALLPQDEQVDPYEGLVQKQGTLDGRV